VAVLLLYFTADELRAVRRACDPIRVAGRTPDDLREFIAGRLEGSPAASAPSATRPG
jgi:hypothetical protein